MENPKFEDKDILAQGAEATLVIVDKDKENATSVIKLRSKKEYRHPTIDTQLRIQRTKQESRILTKLLDNGVRVPKVLDAQETTIQMEYIEGTPLKEALSADNCQFFGQQLGALIAQMHELNIVHGDLTTSNILVKDDQLYLIDFGLAAHSRRLEDKAVDLHILQEAVLAQAPQVAEKFVQHVLQAYPNTEVKERLVEVVARGKNKGKSA